MVRNIKINNLKQLRELLEEDDFSYKNKPFLSAETSFNLWLKKFNHKLNIACPIEKSRVRAQDNKVQVTKEAKLAKAELNNWYLISRRFPIFKCVYKAKKKKYDDIVNSITCRYYNNIICKSNNKMKGLWQAVNHRLGRNNQKDLIVSIYNEEYDETSGKEMCEQFGKHFSAVVENMIAEHFDDNISNSCTTCNMVESSMFFAPITEEETYEIISGISDTKSAGVDEVSSCVIKSVSDIIALQLTPIINDLISEGTFPKVLKTAKVTPVFKKGDIKDINNFRPISVLSVFSKIIERVIYTRTFDYLNKYDLLSSSQHGFRGNHSTESAALHFFTHIHKELDAGKYVAGIFYDFSRAFDTVDQHFVSEKLYNLGIRGNVLNLFKSFLNERTMCVNVNGFNSSNYNLKMGIPQGSVLGPLIFLLFINDISQYVTSGLVINFADDTSIALSADSAMELNILLENLHIQMSEWCYKNKIIMNQKKTKLLLFSHKYDFTIDSSLCFVPNTTFLGFRVGNDLSWDSHVTHICKELNKAFYAILQLKSVIDLNALLNVYYAFVYSKMSYGTVLWGGMRNSKRIFVTQKKIIRLIFSMSSRESCVETFRKYSILTLSSIYIYKSIIYTANNIDKFSRNKEFHGYYTRSANSICVPKHSTTRFEKSPYYRCLVLYNKIPKDARELPIIKLKNWLKRLLINKCYYSVDDFLKDNIYV